MHDEYRNLKVEREGHVAVVTLDRSERGNALTEGFLRELEEVAQSFREDADTRAVIFAGAGRHFSVGMDLKDPRQAEALTAPLLERRRRFQQGPRTIRALREMDQVTIAAINGAAAGGGACIAMALDFRVGAEDCRAGFPESGLAIPLSWTCLPLCVQLVGPSRAKRWLMSGEMLPAAVLAEWGFLDEVAPPEELLPRCLRLAEFLASRPPLALQMIKRSVNAYAGALDQAVMHADTDQVLLAQTGEDFREAVLAFLEKRDPHFRGR